MVANFSLKGENKTCGKAGREEAERKRTAAKSELQVVSVLTEQGVRPRLAAGKAISSSPSTRRMGFRGGGAVPGASAGERKPIPSKSSRTLSPASAWRCVNSRRRSKRPACERAGALFVPPALWAKALGESRRFRVGAHPVSSTHTYNSNFTADLL